MTLSADGAWVLCQSILYNETLCSESFDGCTLKAVQIHFMILP